MIPAWNLEEIVRTLTQAFERRYPEGGIRLVGLLFAPPESSLGESEITKSLNYFHHRSEDKIDFFCAGYRRYGKAKQFVVEREVTSDSVPWYFNVIDFEALRKEIQKSSSWKYSGEADLILLNATKSESCQDVVLDWSSVICCDLEKMKKDKAIVSARRFFEDIFSFVDEYDGTDPVWDLSDQQGAIKAKSGLKRLILSVLPKPLRELYSEAKHLVVRDISRAQSQPYLLTELLLDGDLIVVVEHLLRSTDEQLPEDLTEEKLSNQLENLLSDAEIRVGVPLNENVDAIITHPIIALRAAVVAVRLARKIHGHSPQQVLSLNLLRRDILFGVTGIDHTLEQDAIKRCTIDYEKIAYCLVGALSDVASSSPDSKKKEAMESYSRFCSIVF
ncbi:MAG: hypothetical protein GY847_36105 [Proteobacteria bacterium]|nr:hypothetical protein [Pseudomonadota bacterium]